MISMSKIINREDLGGNIKIWQIPEIKVPEIKEFSKSTIKANPANKTNPTKSDIKLPNSAKTNPEEATFIPAIKLLLSQAQAAKPPKTETVPELTDEQKEKLSAAKIEKISQDAYKQGLERGYQEGIINGFKEGRNEGLTKGHDEGFKLGIEEGKQHGFEQGLEQGMIEGKNAGLTQGINEGYNTGLAQGFNEGRRSGLTQGLEDGRNLGLNQGFEEGNRKGLAQGLEEGKREGLAKGFEQGYRDGLAKSEHEIQDKNARLEQILTFLDQPLADLDSEVEEQLILLVSSIAKQVVQRELRTGSGEIISIIHEALNSLPAVRRNLKIFLHPRDVPLVKVALTTKENELAARIEEDSLITQGGCRIETDSSKIDATVEHRINRVIAQLLDKN